MIKITRTELGWMIGAIEETMHSYHAALDSIDPGSIEERILTIRTNQYAALSERLREAYNTNDKRIAIECGEKQIAKTNKSPCISCKHFATCGDEERKEPCSGKEPIKQI